MATELKRDQRVIDAFGRAVASSLRDAGFTSMPEVLEASDAELMRVRLFGRIALQKVHRLRENQPVALTLTTTVTMEEYETMKRRLSEADTIITSFLLQDHPKISKYSREKMELWVEGKSIWDKTPIGKPKYEKGNI